MKFYKILLILMVFVSGLNPVIAEEFKGTMTWYGQTDLSIPQTGVISEINVAAGDSVKKGTVMLSLQQDTFKSYLQYHKTAREMAQLAMEEANKEFERSQELYDRTLISDHDLALATVAHVNVKADTLKVEADYQKAKQAYEQSKLLAPFDLKVLKLNVRPYEFINTQVENKVALVVASSEKLSVQLKVRESQLSKFIIGNHVNVIVSGKNINGTVEMTELDALSTGGLAKVTITIPYRRNFYIGKSAVVKIR